MCSELISGDDVRKKWKGLRDTYRRELRKSIRSATDASSGDRPAPETSTWVFYRALRFLKPQMKIRSVADKDEAGSDEEMQDWDMSSGRGRPRPLIPPVLQDTGNFRGWTFPCVHPLFEPSCGHVA